MGSGGYPRKRRTKVRVHCSACNAVVAVRAKDAPTADIYGPSRPEARGGEAVVCERCRRANHRSE